VVDGKSKTNSGKKTQGQARTPAVGKKKTSGWVKKTEGRNEKKKKIKKELRLLTARLQDS